MTSIDAETRGRLRRWKFWLSRDYAIVDAILAGEALRKDVEAFCWRGSHTGRQRAFARIRQALAAHGAVLEGARLEGKAPLAVWSMLKPRLSVAVMPASPSEAQGCVAVNYLLLGVLPDERGAADGLWTLEVPDHALGRLLQRSSADPTGCILAAHHAALRLPVAAVVRNEATEFLFAAGPGVFVCETRMGADMDAKLSPRMRLRVRTWLADDMLRDDQKPLADAGLTGARLGDGWLLPAPLSRTWMDEGGVAHGRRIGPGLPETLDAPIGRA
jgi:hypothetical protein